MRALPLAVVLLLASVATASAAPNDGVVTGQIINKTSGGSSPAGTPVILVAFSHAEQKAVSQLTTQADAAGRYTFTGVDRDPNLVYITVARYGGVSYPAEQPFQLVNQATYQADIPTYETTTADDGIRLERLNLLMVGSDQGMLQFMEMGSLVNAGDRTFVTSNPQDQALAHAIRFALPNGALGVQMQAGFRDEDVIAGIGGVQVTSPVPPGRHEFALSFQLPYTGSSADVSVQLPYPTGDFGVYVPDTGPRLQADGLVAGDRADLGGQSYVQYSATNLPRSTLIAGQIVGLGAAPGVLGPTQQALLSLGVVLFVLGAGVLLLRSRPRRVEQERLTLVQQLASLDDRFARGEVDEQDYKVEREQGKRRLVALTLTQRGHHSN